MIISKNFILSVGILFCSCAVTQQACAQELKKVKADYHSGGVQYSPDDPWVRSKVFQAHTGHAGFFYNCDDEECKRYSPYIKWTTNCQPLVPQRRGLLNGIREDLAKVRWRIDAGSCACEECAAVQHAVESHSWNFSDTQYETSSQVVGEPKMPNLPRQNP